MGIRYGGSIFFEFVSFFVFDVFFMNYFEVGGYGVERFVGFFLVGGYG